MKNVKKLVAVLSAGLLLVLTGCSSTNSAATIGKTEIPLSTVQGSISEILKERAKIDTQGMNLSTGAELNTNAIRFHVISVIFDDIATKISLKLKDSEIAARRADIILQIGGEDRLASSLVGAQIAPKDFPRYLRTVLLAEKFGDALKAQGDTSTDGSGIQKLIVAMGKEKKVKINPRYGSWDYENGNIVPAPDNAAVKK
ncbi:MAG: SurA N-terminal domain-containing protein [Candidatus Nanopelagicaceae bacterium]